jgi:RNA polymerase sigma factor (sigma-70 family)
MEVTVKSEKDQLSDEEVVGRIMAGEQRLYEVIMRRYNARLYRIGMSIVNNDTEVEDLMQVAYIKAYENLHKFEGRSGFGTWLTRILINECLYQVKKNKRYMKVELNSEAPLHGNEHGPANKLLNKELAGMLEDALVQIPEKYRMVFVMREMENMSTAETMDTLNLSEANVKVRLNRAKAMLRDSLSGYYKDDAIYSFHLTRCDRIVNSVLSRLGISPAL